MIKQFKNGTVYICVLVYAVVLIISLIIKILLPQPDGKDIERYAEKYIKDNNIYSAHSVVYSRDYKDGAAAITGIDGWRVTIYDETGSTRVYYNPLTGRIIKTDRYLFSE